MTARRPTTTVGSRREHLGCGRAHGCDAGTRPAASSCRGCGRWAGTSSLRCASTARARGTAWCWRCPTTWPSCRCWRAPTASTRPVPGSCSPASRFTCRSVRHGWDGCATGAASRSTPVPRFWPSAGHRRRACRSTRCTASLRPSRCSPGCRPSTGSPRWFEGRSCLCSPWRDCLTLLSRHRSRRRPRPAALRSAWCSPPWGSPTPTPPPSGTRSRSAQRPVSSSRS